MTSLLTVPMAAAIIALDELGDATLSELARAIDKPVSTMQRAVDRLLASHVIERETPRGSLQFTADAPRTALRDLAKWRLGPDRAREIATAAHHSTFWPSPPGSIHDPRIRAAWPRAIRSIVRTYRPSQVILFGSQARGDADDDSDVDLLVIFDDRALDRRERRVEIRRLLGAMPFAKDVLVASANDVRHPSPGTAVADAIRTGLVVYDR